MAKSVGGGVFSYARDQPVEPILHKILAWEKPKSISSSMLSTPVEANKC